MDKNKNTIKKTSLWGLLSNYAKPSIYISHFSKLEPLFLQKQGIKIFLCDLDNTLVPHYNKFPNKDVITFIQKIQSSGMKFIIVSNNTTKRVKFFAEKTNADGFYANAKKPFPHIIKKIIKEHNVHSKEVVMMGDLIFTDIIAANLSKIESILVPAIISDGYGWNKINKFLEKILYRYLERRNILIKGEFDDLNNINLDYQLL